MTVRCCTECHGTFLGHNRLSLLRHTRFQALEPLRNLQNAQHLAYIDAGMQALRRATLCSKLRNSCLSDCAIINAGRHATARHRCCSTATAVPSAVFIAPAEEHLQHLATMLAQQREAGDCYLLYGSVGAGKSVFSRAFIRAAAEDPHLPVPSPTYLLQLIYAEQEGPSIHHFDLYRLDAAQDMSRLDLAGSFSSSVSLVEWAERLPCQQLPAQRLEVQIQIVNHGTSDSSTATSSCSSWQQQLQQMQQQCLQEVQQQQQQQQQQQSVPLQETLLLPTPVLQDAVATAAAAAGVEESILLGDGSDDNDGGFEEEEEELFTDQRWRSVQLTAVGDRWVERLRQLAQELQQQQAVTAGQ